MVDKAESLNYTFGKSGAAARGHAGRLHKFIFGIAGQWNQPGNIRAYSERRTIESEIDPTGAFFDYHWVAEIFKGILYLKERN